MLRNGNFEQFSVFFILELGNCQERRQEIYRNCPENNSHSLNHVCCVVYFSTTSLMRLYINLYICTYICECVCVSCGANECGDKFALKTAEKEGWLGERKSGENIDRMRKFSIHFPQQPHTLTNRMRFHTKKTHSPSVTLPLFIHCWWAGGKGYYFYPTKNPNPPPLFHLIPTLSDKTKKKTFSFLFLYFFFFCWHFS